MLRAFLKLCIHQRVAMDMATTPPAKGILGGFEFNSAGEVKAAAESLKGLKCKNTYLHENCVDWTKQAVNHLREKGTSRSLTRNMTTFNLNITFNSNRSIIID